MRAAILAALLLAGCAHDPLDTTEIDAAALDARNRVNDLAESLGELATPIMMFCAMVGDDDAKCEGLRATYDAGRAAVISAQRYIDAFAKTGQGAALVDAGVTVIEAAVDDVRSETERLLGEVANVAGIGDAGNEGGGAAGAADSEASGQPGAGDAAEGEGAAEAAGPREADAREVGTPASGETAVQ